MATSASSGTPSVTKLCDVASNSTLCAGISVPKACCQANAILGRMAIVPCATSVPVRRPETAEYDGLVFGPSAERGGAARLGESASSRADPGQTDERFDTDRS